jgi:hypothetical protein
MGSEGEPSWVRISCRLVSTMGPAACRVERQSQVVLCISVRVQPAPVPRSYCSGPGPVFNPTGRSPCSTLSIRVLFPIRSHTVESLASTNAGEQISFLIYLHAF